METNGSGAKPTLVSMTDSEIFAWVEKLTRSTPSTPAEMLTMVRVQIQEAREARGRAFKGLARKR